MWPDSLNVAGLESFWEAIDNDTGTSFLCIYWIFGIQSVWILTFLDLEGGGRNLNFPQGRKSWLPLGTKREEEREGEWEGVGKRGVNGNFYNLIKLLKKRKRKSEDPGQMCCRHEETMGCKNRLLYPAKFSITINGENKIFHDKNSN